MKLWLLFDIVLTHITDCGIDKSTGRVPAPISSTSTGTGSILTILSPTGKSHSLFYKLYNWEISLFILKPVLRTGLQQSPCQKQNMCTLNERVNKCSCKQHYWGPDGSNHYNKGIHCFQCVGFCFTMEKMTKKVGIHYIRLKSNTHFHQRDYDEI